MVETPAVDMILSEFEIDDAVSYLERVEDQVKTGFSKEPTVFIVGNVELAREKKRDQSQLG